MKNVFPIYEQCPYCGEDLKIIITKKRKKASIKCSFGKFERKVNKNHVLRGEISQVRINNIIKAFKHISWDKDSAAITIMGYGDKPAFTIDGVFKKYDGIFPDIKVQYHTSTPGGGQARLYFWVKEKRYRILANLKDSRKITLKMLRKYHRLLGKEYILDFHESGYGYLFTK